MSYPKASTYVVAILVICVLTFLTFNSTGCTKKETVTEVVHDTTMQNIFFCTLGRWYSSAYLITIPIIDSDSADVMKISDSDTVIFVHKYLEDAEDPTAHQYINFDDTTQCNPGENYEVKLESSVGTAEGNITIPENAYIAQPLENDTVPFGDVVILCTQAQYADFYEIDGYLSVYDSSGSWITDHHFDTLITTTSWILPSSYFDYPGAARVYVSFYLLVYAGAMPIPGSQGNMSGSIAGYLLGQGIGDHRVFYIGSSTIQTNENHNKRFAIFKTRNHRFLQKLNID